MSVKKSKSCDLNDMVGTNVFWHVFSILGMNLFGCKFCQADPIIISPTTVVSQPVGSQRVCHRKNFDNLLWAIITVFQVSDCHSLMTLEHTTFTVYAIIITCYIRTSHPESMGWIGRNILSVSHPFQSTEHSGQRQTAGNSITLR